MPELIAKSALSGHAPLTLLGTMLAEGRAPADIDTGEIRARMDGLGLSRHLSSNRTQGLASMVARIGELAALA